MEHKCYLIINSSGKTYIGYTNNEFRRLRQHNGALKGGARYTQGKGPWRYIALICSDGMDKNTALSLEWWLKHPLGKRGWHLDKRLSVLTVLANPKFENMSFCVYAHPNDIDFMRDACDILPNVDVKPLANIGC